MLFKFEEGDTVSCNVERVNTENFFKYNIKREGFVICVDFFNFSNGGLFKEKYITYQVLNSTDEINSFRDGGYEFAFNTCRLILIEKINSIYIHEL